jgi:hypothetical protein
MIKAVSTFDEKPFKVPGPGTYNAQETGNRRSVSLSGRLNDFSDKWILSVPGPGTYKTLELIDKNMKSKLSKFGNSPSVRFSRSKRTSEVEVMQRVLEVPGPGNCNSLAT